MKNVLICLLMLALCLGVVARGQNDKEERSESGRTESNAEDGTYDPFGAYEDTITLSYSLAINPTTKLSEGETYDNNQYTRYIKNNLNIDVEAYWQVASGNDEEQRINLAIASNDLPDVMVVNRKQFYKLVKSEQIADMTQVIENYAAPFVKYMMRSFEGKAEAEVTFDGKMMAMPSLNVQDDNYHIMWIRKDWLDALGLDVPKTVEDLTKVAKAFVEQDPDGNGEDDTIGIGGPSNGGRLYGDFLNPTNCVFGFDPIFAAYKAFPGFWLEDDAGNAIYGSILPETKQALTRLANLYAEGLIDPQMGIRKSANETLASGQCGLYFGVWWGGYWPLPDSWDNDPDANWQAYPIYADDGNAYFHMGTSSSTFCVVNKNYAYPEAAMKIININNRDEKNYDTSIESGEQVLRLPLGVSNESQFEIEELKKYLAGEVTLADYTEQELAVYKLLRLDMSTISDVKLEPYDDMNLQYWNADHDNFMRLYSLFVGTRPIYDPATNKVEAYSLIYSQTETMESKWNNLAKLEEEAFLKIIMGVDPIESFDEFVENWKRQGGDEITAEVQAIAEK